MHDMMLLRNGKFERLPDLVVWPKSHDDVVKIVEAANDIGVVIIPIGGEQALHILIHWNFILF